MSNKIDSERIARLKVNALRFMVLAGMMVTVIISAFVPGSVKNILHHSYGMRGDESVWLTVYIYLSVLPFLTALFAVKQICDIISDGDSFSMRSLKKLSVIVWCCVAEMAVSGAAFVINAILPDMLWLGMSMLSLFLIALAAVIAVFATVLKELVKSAIRIREENELTI